MQRLSRPPAGPLPRRRAIVAHFRRLEPRRVLIRLAIGVMTLATLQTGLEWRSTIDGLGTRITVPVVQRDISAGSVLGPADIELRAWPRGLVPADAIDHVPIGATTRDDLVAGEVLVEQRLFPDNNGLGAEDRLVTVPTDSAPALLEPGTRVDLYGILSVGDGFTTGSTRLASGTVVSTTDRSAAIAVPESVVPLVLDHLALGVIDLVVLP